MPPGNVVDGVGVDDSLEPVGDGEGVVLVGRGVGFIVGVGFGAAVFEGRREGEGAAAGRVVWDRE
ncbi:hypothetical protein [Spirillospora sp. NBC_01491]|uniref:hypothetical protein n=1 Tax=Spirillospora sp. NBC_01491 TaxID=2976007 RepID=UPI002E3176C1|nr:hypothetical protein [Spirillospora sp. NBC_01491]